jgi:uncharacterized protein (TIGR02646 family)
MIHVPFGATPASLDGPNSAGGRETQRAIDFYRVKTNRQGSFTFEAYKGADVIAAYKADFLGKCAYCESPYVATQPVDSEHYRPKGGYFKGGQLKKPGYYWLAADWRNLLPSCVDCNRGRIQHFADEPKHLSGKTNFFPIADEKARATKPGAEAREQRLLLNPRLDDPEQHLEFVADGIICERLDQNQQPNPMGVESVKVYGLQRDGLVSRRKVTFDMVTGAIGGANFAAGLLRASPGNDGLRVNLGFHVNALRRSMGPSQSYAALARQMAKPVIAALEMEFGPIGPDPVMP